MADLTPDEVMAKHQPIWATIGVAEVDACGRCSCVPTDGLSVKTFTLWPCDAYLMAERAKTAEARVTALEAVVSRFAAQQMKICDAQGLWWVIVPPVLITRAVELMEENNDAG